VSEPRSPSFDDLVARLESTISQAPPSRGSLRDPDDTSPPFGGEEPASFDDLVARLESTIGLLADGTAPLDELVSAHQRATSLLSEAEMRLETLKARADQLVISLRE
jgi:exodeoxyribonuclease VII small subunit